MAHIVRAHAVEVSKILTVSPLTSGGQMVSPDAGVVLGLESGVRHKWVLEANGINPVSGDYLVTDATLRVSYIITAGHFAELFTTTD
jgi:hypothetical protein